MTQKKLGKGQEYLMLNGQYEYENEQIKQNSGNKDELISIFQDSILQLEGGLTQISREAENLVRKNMKYKRDMANMRKEIESNSK